jgi:hypothetical protein
MQPTLPPLWAALRQADASPSCVNGPELQDVCQRTGRSAGELFDITLRRFRGLYLLPLEWVAGHWQRVVEIYADISEFPDLQIFAPRSVPGDLHGYQGAAAFDFRMPLFRRRLIPSIGRNRARRRMATAMFDRNRSVGAGT